MVSFILPGNSASGGYEVANSLRFDGSSAYLSRTHGTPTNAKKHTFSAWVKMNPEVSSHNFMFGVHNDANNQCNYYWRSASDDRLSNENTVSGSSLGGFYTTRKFRDPSAWFHIVVAEDTTQSTDTNRVKVYVNGVQETAFDTMAYIAQNTDNIINSNGATVYIGQRGGSYGYLDGYMAEMVFIDGEQLDQTSFGEFDSDSNIWKPKDVSGLTFGNNGFYLDFENSGSLGADVSGNGNNFTAYNLAATDQSTDTCTNNYCTMNPLNVPTSNQPTFSEGSLKTVSSSSASGAFGGSTTFGVSQGKWYVEAKATVGSTYSRNAIGVSYNPAEMARSNADTQISNTSYAWGWESSGGEVRHDASAVASYATYATGDICQIFLDLDNHKLYFGKNGTLQSSTGISLDTGETYFIVQTDRTGSSEVSTFEFNFGAGTTFSISSGNTDGEYGNFEYSTTITGDGASKTFKALNTKNLAEYG